jgi:hypothetical protein
MSDGKFALTKIRELLLADTLLQALATGGIPIEIAEFSPVGNTYPQICLDIDEGSSEMVFPAGHYKLAITMSVKKDSTQPYKMIRDIAKRVNAVLNRKASSLSEINVMADTGLRIAKCLKSDGGIWFDKTTNLYNDEIVFDMVISEGESFNPANAGNLPWL